MIFEINSIESMNNSGINNDKNIIWFTDDPLKKSKPNLN